MCQHLSVQRSFEGSIIVRNVGKHSPNYTVSHPKRFETLTTVQLTNKHP